MSLARDRRLVEKLRRELFRALERDQQPLALVLEEAVVLGYELEREIAELDGTEPDPGTADRLLERTLALTRKLGPMMKHAQKLEDDND